MCFCYRGDLAQTRKANGDQIRPTRLKLHFVGVYCVLVVVLPLRQGCGRSRDLLEQTLHVVRQRVAPKQTRVFFLAWSRGLQHAIESRGVARRSAELNLRVVQVMV